MNKEFNIIVNIEMNNDNLLNIINITQALVDERFGVYDDKDVHFVCSELTRSILETSNLKIFATTEGKLSGSLSLGSFDEPLNAVLRMSDNDCLEPYITCPVCLTSGFIDDFTVVKNSEGEYAIECPNLNCEEIIMKF